MSYVSGSAAQFLILLEDAFEAGFSAGFHSEDNPTSHEEEWEEYKKEHLSEYELLSGGMKISLSSGPTPKPTGKNNAYHEKRIRP